MRSRSAVLFLCIGVLSAAACTVSGNQIARCIAICAPHGGVQRMDRGAAHNCACNANGVGAQVPDEPLAPVPTSTADKSAADATDAAEASTTLPILLQPPPPAR